MSNVQQYLRRFRRNWNPQPYRGAGRYAVVAVNRQGR